MNVRQIFERARSLEKKGRNSEAYSLYIQILKVYPENIRALKALEHLKNLIKNDTKQNPPSEIINDLLTLFNKSQFSIVIKQTQALINDYPKAFILWNILGVCEYKTSMPVKAIKAYKKAILIKPNYAEAFNNMGVALKDIGNVDEAIRIFKKAILIKPDYVEAYNNLGIAYKDQYKSEEAIKAYKRAISLKPDYAEAYNNLANSLNDLGRFEEALKYINKSILLKPNYFLAFNNLGVSLSGQGKLDDAAIAFKKVLLLNPNYADAYNNLGNVLKAQDKLDDAIGAYRNAILINPDYAFSYNSIGEILMDQGKFQDAIDEFKNALLADPSYLEAYNNKGIALGHQNKFQEAINVFKKAIILKPDNAEAFNNLGKVLDDQGKQDQAINAFKSAVSINPAYAQAYSNMGVTIKNLGNLEEAMEMYNKAILLKPDFAEALYNLSYPYNLKGDLQKGLELYEWRLKKDRFAARIPREHLVWDGKKSILDKKFFVYEEQGLGDIIQFCRYLPLLKQKGAKVIFKVKPKMHTLLRTLDEDIAFVDRDPDDKSIDFETPLMSLPYLFKTNLHTIPSISSYLSADHNKIMLWNKRLTKNCFKVGICWQGSKAKIDFGRSFPLNLFEDISKLINVELISLHKGEGEKQIDDINFDLTVLDNDFDNGEDAFIDTAAVMANCDLIITSDTAIAHLAGALGCPTWVVLKKIPDWRWMLDRNDSPWYPNMKLYRQKERDNWEEVFETIKKDLQTLIKLKEN